LAEVICAKLSTKGQVGKGRGEVVHSLVEIASQGKMDYGRWKIIHLMVEIIAKCQVSNGMGEVIHRLGKLNSSQKVKWVMEGGRLSALLLKLPQKFR